MRGVRRFFANAALLTVSALIMRSVSVSFGVYVSNTAGAEAMGLFSLIMSVFGFALTIATSGINLAVIRMVSEALGTGDEGLGRKSMKKCVSYCLICSTVAGGILFLFADVIGVHILKDERTVFSLRVLACALPFISVTSALGGYFTAVRRVYKNTIFQTFEQFIKMFFTVKMFELYIDKGIEYACISLVVADAISEASAFAISASMYYFDKRKHIKNCATSVSDSLVTKKLYSIALPIAFSTYIRSGLLTIEHVLIPRGLTRGGLGKSEALASYGTLHSMVMPVVLFPTAILSSFSSLLIPEIAEATVKKQKALVQNIAGRAFQYSFIFSFCIAGLLICFSGELGIMIYGNTEVSRFIKLISPLVPIMYLDSVTDATLKGLGKQVYSMNVNIIDAVLSIICVIILLPRYGIWGYVITIYVTELINASLSILKLLSVTEMRPRVYRWVFSPLISIIGASSVGKIIFNLIEMPFSVNIQVVSGCIIIALFYILFLNLTGGVSKRDRVWIKTAIGIKRCSAALSAKNRDARKYSAPSQLKHHRNIQKC